jgi:predicted enzyme related to lactoylglutathione lyase
MTGAVLYVVDLVTMARFYSTVVEAETSITDDVIDQGVVVLRCPDGFELTLVTVPDHVAATIDVQAPATAREDTPIKLSFDVADVDTALERVAAGGGCRLDRPTWVWRGRRFADCLDPEGNVLQLSDTREPAV